jgi:5-formyltetrahydrofolate cyclo-ligase
MDESEVRSWRRATRAALIERRMAVPPATRRQWGAAIEPALEALIRGSGARTVGFYWPFKAEFDPRAMVTRLLDAGFRAALPVVVEKKRPMIFRLWTPRTEMTNGIWDIPVPKDSAAVVPDLLLAPVVGFDAAHYRLGYGGGYFDRTLGSLSPRPIAVGVGFELGRLETIFPQGFDVPMRHVVTEAGVDAVLPPPPQAGEGRGGGNSPPRP